MPVFLWALPSFYGALSSSAFRTTAYLRCPLIIEFPSFPSKALTGPQRLRHPQNPCIVSANSAQPGYSASFSEYLAFPLRRRFLLSIRRLGFLTLKTPEPHPTVAYLYQLVHD